MEQELLEIIKKSLPEMQVKAISEMYEEVEGLRRNAKDDNVIIKTLKSELEGLREKVRELELDVSAHGNLDAKIAKLEEKEKQFYKKEFEHKLSIVEIQLTAERDKTNQAIGMFETIFKNRRVREDVQGTIKLKDGRAESVYHGDGTYGTVVVPNEYTTPSLDTKTVEEE